MREIERKTTTYQRVPNGEGVIGERQKQHQKRMTKKKDPKKKRPSDERSHPRKRQKARRKGSSMEGVEEDEAIEESIR